MLTRMMTWILYPWSARNGKNSTVLSTTGKEIFNRNESGDESDQELSFSVSLRGRCREPGWSTRIYCTLTRMPLILFHHQGRPWHRVQWLENKGMSEFRIPQDCAIFQAPTKRVEPADIDEDKHVDLFVVSAFNLRIDPIPTASSRLKTQGTSAMLNMKSPNLPRTC